MAKSGSYIPVKADLKKRIRQYIEKTIVPIFTAKVQHKYDLSILFLTRKIFFVVGGHVTHKRASIGARIWRENRRGVLVVRYNSSMNKQ